MHIESIIGIYYEDKHNYANQSERMRNYIDE